VDLHLLAEERLKREVSTVSFDPDRRLRVLLAYPNTYAVGMSNLGLHTVYRMLNSHPEVGCERVFLPDADEMEEYRSSGTPLFSLETQTAAADFDVIAFSAAFENDYPNILALLDLAGLPFRATDRDERHPLVAMGGATVSINPEPVAPFLDLCCLGEGEELVGPLVDALLEASSRNELLERLADEPGFYVPAAYEAVYEPREAGADRYAGTRPRGDAPATVTKVRATLDGPDRVAATAILTPDTEFGDRILVEVARGCTKGCRYCWVGYSILPFRVHRPEDILAAVAPWKGHCDRVGLVATALLDHPDIEAIAERLQEDGFRIHSPSLIISTLREPLLDAVIASGQETITVAPEAGSDRMRQLIMKKISNEEILDKARMIFRAGAVNLKNYIIIGLPGESEEDLQAIVDLGSAMRDIMVQECRHRGRIGTVTLSVNCLIPKPGTPLQWARQVSTSEYKRKLRWLQRRIGRIPNLVLDAMPPWSAEIQAVLSRGDRRVSTLLERWHETGNWRRALREWTADGNPSLEEHRRERVPGEPTPWDHLRIGPSAAALRNQWGKAMEVAAAPASESAP
jgi:radical SAM superfamily enzyme YgiQ (UPF0313 family)